MVDEKYEQNMLRLLVIVVYAVCTCKPQGTLILQFHRSWKRSQR